MLLYRSPKNLIRNSYSSLHFKGRKNYAPSAYVSHIEAEQNFRRAWIAGYLLVCFVIGWYILSKNFSPGISYKSSWTPLATSKIISDIYPAERMTLAEEKNGLSFQKVLDEPIYFDVKFPQHLREVSLGIKAQTETKVLLGTKTEPGWKWILKTLDLERDGSWSQGSVSFGRDEIIVNDRHWARFIIASPEFDSSRQELKIAKIFIEIKK